MSHKTAGPTTGLFSGFAFIVVMFILLIIIGAAYV
ncbi:YjcZ family sporulation protein [Evansella tamaricis]|uniref:YjcZ family sporulation protein n=1 Tax=Evansella tamaricis TaxID=2069301 RepID=A0ABS6JID9_9BACI|nr:YjcZ family sporulation protein [Evansella tamaricis]MBU9713145.1 YjcZ family sporulation protein [Evansella tamaricis]